MEFSRSNGFLTILSDSINLLPKNGKLMVLVAFLSLFLNAGFLLLFAYTLQSLVLDMAAATRHSTGRSPFTPGKGFDPIQVTHLLHQPRKDAAVLFVFEVAFILAFSTISFFSIISTILMSAISYNAKNLSPKELIGRSWMRPLITNLYVSALSTAYLVVVFMFAAPLWIYPGLPTFWLAIMIFLPSFIFYLYLVVPWNMSVVVSVVEESHYGLEALGRAAVLVKGKRLHGFLLSVIYGIVACINLEFYRMKMGKKEITVVPLMLLMVVSCLGKILMFVAYTVFYFHCKMHHGEEIELHARLKYAKLSTDDMP